MTDVGRLEVKVFKRTLPILIGLAAVAGLVALLSFWDSAEVVVDRDWALGDTCPDAVVIGVAGSGQRDDVSGFGPQVESVVLGFSEHLTDRASSNVSVGVVALDYPAPSVVEGGLLGFLGASMFDSIIQGRETLTSLVAATVERCPDVLMYLVGYSQGASVVHSAVVDLPAEARGSVGAVVVLADPNRDADDPNTEHHTTEPASLLIPITTPHTRDGVFGPISSPEWLNGSLHSACARGDAVCNFALADVLTADAVHTDETYHGLGPQLGRLLADHLLTRL